MISEGLFGAFRGVSEASEDFQGCSEPFSGFLVHFKRFHGIQKNFSDF